MLRYLQWFSIAGIWIPVLVVAAWFSICWLVATVFPGASAGWGLAIIGMLITFSLAHAVAASALVGLGLLLARRTPRVAFTSVSAVTGLVLSGYVLSTFYLAHRQ